MSHGHEGPSSDVAAAALAALPEMSVLVFDADLRFVLAGGTALDEHGYDAEALIGRRLDDVVPGPAANRLRPSYEAALRGARTRFEHRTSSPDRVYDVQIAPLERSGVIVGGIAISRDVTEQHRSARSLARSAREYRDLAEQSSDVVSRSDAHGVYTYVSPSSERIYGWRPDEMVGRPVTAFLHRDDHAADALIRERLEAGGDEDVAERRMCRPDGSEVWVESRFRALRDDDGAFLGVQTAARDISDRKAAESARRIADEQFRTAFDDALVGIALVAPNGAWLRVNQALCAILGYSSEQLTAMTFQDITHPDDLEADLALLQDVLAGVRSGYQMEKRYIRSDGNLAWVLLSVSLVRDDDGAPLHFISQVQDISERARLEAELRTLAARDHLTGLYNRRYFEQALEHQLGRIRRYGETASVLFIDLDGLKQINDSLGHHAGDEILKQLGATMRARVRESDVLARLGGDEFAVLLPHTAVTNAADLVRVLEAEFERNPARFDGAELRPQASIGVAALDAEMNVETALRRADEAMYQIKSARRRRP